MLIDFVFFVIMFQIGFLFFVFTSLVFADWVLEENKALALSSESNLPILAVFRFLGRIGARNASQ